MTLQLHRQTDITLSSRREVRRRDFLRALPVAGAAVGTLGWVDRLTAETEALRKRGMACILLWMAGGPSQYETMSPKPGHENGGETEAIKTSVSGIEISANLPKVAQEMHDICLIRSMNSREGAHARASYLMHTSYLPSASVKYPTLGANVAQQIADPEFDLPSFVRVGGGRGAGGGGLLGVGYDPFVINNAQQPPQNTAVPTSERRYRRRLGLLGRLEKEYAASGGKQEVENQKQVYSKASKMVLSPKMNAFDIDREPQRVRDAYGEGGFASGCLMARRLVESGVTFVEVASNGWDTHDNGFERVSDLCQQVDQPYAALLRDLRERGMLDNTLVIWAGEFGRTPRINARGGRDHYPVAFNIALSGAGVKGGQVIGKTDAGGVTVTDRPVGVSDLLRTVYHAVGVDTAHEHMSSIGRPIPIVDGGEVVDEVFT